MNKLYRAIAGCVIGVATMAGSLIGWHEWGVNGMVAFILTIIGAGIVCTSLDINSQQTDEDDEE